MTSTADCFVLRFLVVMVRPPCRDQEIVSQSTSYHDHT